MRVPKLPGDRPPDGPISLRWLSRPVRSPDISSRDAAECRWGHDSQLRYVFETTNFDRTSAGRVQDRNRQLIERRPGECKIAIDRWRDSRSIGTRASGASAHVFERGASVTGSYSGISLRLTRCQIAHYTMQPDLRKADTSTHQTNTNSQQQRRIHSRGNRQEVGLFIGCGVKCDGRHIVQRSDSISWRIPQPYRSRRADAVGIPTRGAWK